MADNDTRSPTTHPKRELAEMIYERRNPGETLPARVAELAAEGKSWRAIREAVGEATGMWLSHETVRTWYGQSSELAAT